MNAPTHVIVHCSDSLWGDARVIDGWHKERGFGCIGYHWVVLNGFRSYAAMKDDRRDTAIDGLVEQGRPEEAIGAHALGYNNRSIGICLIGSGHYTPAQMRAAVLLVREVQQRYGIANENVLGHCETALSGGKTCPILDMPKFRALVAGPEYREQSVAPIAFAQEDVCPSK